MKRFTVVYESKANGVRAEWSTMARSGGEARDKFFEHSSALWYEVVWVVECATGRIAG